MSRTPVRTALVGCGKVGRIQAQALRSLDTSEFVAACDPDPARAAAFAEEFGVRPFTDLRELLRDGGAEAVSICTPHPQHAAPAVLAAEAGAHVLVEKPLAASVDDCDAMIAAAARAGVKLGVISQRRWFEPVRRMKRAIDEGKIGRPVLGGFTMYSWRDEAYYRSDPWRGRWDTEGGGVLINQSPHMLDLLLWLMGDDVAEVSAYWSNLNHPYVEVEDTVVASIRFARGGLGSIVSSLSQKPGIHTKVHIHGESGASVGVETDRGATFIAGMTAIAEPPLNDIWTVPGEERELARFEAEDRAQFAAVDATSHYHRLQIEDFLRSVIDDRPPAVTAEDGRRVVALIDAIYRSGREGKPVRPERSR
ncbi:Glucose--fructose oxidoreductase precursor [Aquisphaera giovannonii]|uniref:Glucose--fructose oxidoreductase n=1 Tax=Aquisphaera giovannonii TaxID=406548 RepID=A0A5B9WDQ5_9BACT|nr:Gfo/Idh/MocA family oxidoreductase [Aquisphaera giovannonii]QEH38798.1 Glucose--fructose oxidoreductase precursor [Aquisphaera giovannonii]